MYDDLHNGADMAWICEITSSSHLALARGIYGWRCWEGGRKERREEPNEHSETLCIPYFPCSILESEHELHLHHLRVHNIVPTHCSDVLSCRCHGVCILFVP